RDEHARVLRDEAEQPFDLLLEDPDRLVHLLDVVRVPAAGVRHRAQQSLVVILAEADRRRGDAMLARGRAQADELLRVRDASVGETVREEQDPADRAIRAGALDQLPATQPAAAQVGRAAALDGLDAA